MIVVKDVEFSYPTYEEGDVAAKVLRGVDIKIQAGEFVAVVGHNGCGKSTLARHLNALLVPLEGDVSVSGISAGDEKRKWEIRRLVGMLFQNPDNQIVATTVEADVAFGLENLGVPQPEMRSRVDSALQALGMCQHAGSMPHYLSGGQKQRVAIAGVLAMQSKYIVLDEPTAMLDPSGRKEVLEAVKQLNQQHGITVILITHFMEEAAQAGRIIVMHEGKVELTGTPREVFAHAAHLQEIGLGVPQATTLALKLASVGVAVDGVVVDAQDFAKRVDFAGNMPQVPSATAKKERSKLLLEVDDVTHVYGNGTPHYKQAISNISMNIYEGEIVAIIGHTGSGKSTLIQHFNALVAPTSGEVRLDGKNINADKKGLKAIRQKVGLVFQYPEHQLFETTVYKDVAFGAVRMGLSGKELDDRVRYALDAVGVNESLFQRSPFELSGGQKRRVAIAGVLAMQPQVLVLDEPAAGLDPRGKEEILELILSMHRQLNLTVVLVSHSMEDVARLAQRIFVLSDGKLVCQGSPSFVFQQGSMLEGIGLDVPQVAKILTAAGMPGVYTIEDALAAFTREAGV